MGSHKASDFPGHATGQHGTFGNDETLEQLHARGVWLNFELMDDYVAGCRVPPIAQLGHTPALFPSTVNGVGPSPFPQADAYLEPQSGTPGYYAPYDYARPYAPAPSQTLPPYYGQYSGGHPYLSGNHIHLLGQQAEAYGRRGTPAPAIQFDDIPRNPTTTLGAAPIGRKRAMGPWPKYTPIRIVHTCEDVAFVKRFKFGVWVNRVDDPVDAPERKVIVPCRDGSTEEVWRCGKWACRFCKRTADGYTDLTASVAASHGIAGVPVKDHGIGQAPGVMVQSDQKGNTAQAAAFLASESHRSAPVGVPGRAQLGLDHNWTFENIGPPTSRSIGSLSNVNDIFAFGHRQATLPTPVDVKAEELPVHFERMRQRASERRLARPGSVLEPQMPIEPAPQQPGSHGDAKISEASESHVMVLSKNSGLHPAGQPLPGPEVEATNGNVVARVKAGDDETPKVETRSAKLVRGRREIAFARSWPLTE